VKETEIRLSIVTKKEKLAKNKLYLVVVQEVRWDKGDNEAVSD
jgi:hypothetical protein